MVDFDEDITKWMNKHNGMYRRYSDDLILVIPTNNAEDVATDYVKELKNLWVRSST